MCSFVPTRILINIARLLDLTKLCKRCREADYEGFLNGRDETRPQYTRILYPQGSFRDDCTVCTLFSSLIDRRFKGAIGKMKPGEEFGVTKHRLWNHELGGPLHPSIDFAFNESWTQYVIANINQSGILDQRDPCKYTAVSDIPSEDEVADQIGANFGRIKSWLNFCERHHRGRCFQKPAKWSVEKIKVIDCRTGQLCDIDSGHT